MFTAAIHLQLCLRAGQFCFLRSERVGSAVQFGAQRLAAQSLRLELLCLIGQFAGEFLDGLESSCCRGVSFSLCLRFKGNLLIEMRMRGSLRAITHHANRLGATDAHGTPLSINITCSLSLASRSSTACTSFDKCSKRSRFSVSL